MPPLPEPICNLDAEQGVLSAILLDNTAYWKITETLPEEAFYKPSHRKIYAPIYHAWERQDWDGFQQAIAAAKVKIVSLPCKAASRSRWMPHGTATA